MGNSAYCNQLDSLEARLHQKPADLDIHCFLKRTYAVQQDIKKVFISKNQWWQIYYSHNLSLLSAIFFVYCLDPDQD